MVKCTQKTAAIMLLASAVAPTTEAFSVHHVRHQQRMAATATASTFLQASELIISEPLVAGENSTNGLIVNTMAVMHASESPILVPVDEDLEPASPVEEPTESLLVEEESLPSLVESVSSQHALLEAFILKRPDLQITWEVDIANQIRQAADKLAAEQEATKCSIRRPFMVGVVGIPGSGKSTGAEIVAELLGESSFCMPMDGYHYCMDHLRNHDPEQSDDLIYRRGAADTFDDAALLADIQAIKDGVPSLYLPGFDHAMGDPVAAQHYYENVKTDIVIAEGLYLLHWREIAECLDMCIFVDADVDTCMERLKIRNCDIPGYTQDEIAIRVDAVDRVNALTVDASKPFADIVVQSSASLQRKDDEECLL